MANNNSLLTFLAGAAVGAALYAYVKADKERIVEILDKLEDKIGNLGNVEEKPSEEAPAEE